VLAEKEKHTEVISLSANQHRVSRQSSSSAFLTFASHAVSVQIVSMPQGQVVLIDVALVNARVDLALDANRRAERVIIIMALALFIGGLVACLVAYCLRSQYVATGGACILGFLVYPIGEIRKLRRDNIILQTFPILIARLPRDRAATELSKLLAYLLERVR
jgi:hypothetical protein